MARTRRSTTELAAEVERLARRTDNERDRAELLHEIQVYQEEVTAQNEELLNAQAALEETRDRFIDLYDFAPNGYLTLDRDGVIVQINLTGAALLGRPRQAIVGVPLRGFVHARDRALLVDFHRRCRRSEDGHGVDVALSLDIGGTRRQVDLLCRPRLHRASGRREFLTTMIDTTDRHRLEAERSALAAERAALLTRLITAQDQERHRIARDLHDDLGQLVTGLRLHCDIIAGQPLTERMAENVNHARSILQSIDRRVSFLAGTLRPASLNLGIVPALQQHIAEWRQTFNIDAAFQVVGPDVRLPAEVETHLYRIVQESLNNVAKHASATCVDIVLNHGAAAVHLTIEDNGRGFANGPGGARTNGSGFGLGGMRERAALAGGTFKIESVEGKGTTVKVTVPIGPTHGSFIHP